jgi:hypothetical protein
MSKLLANGFRAYLSLAQYGEYVIRVTNAAGIVQRQDRYGNEDIAREIFAAMR